MKNTHSIISVSAATLAAGAVLFSAAIVQANDVFLLSFTGTGRYQAPQKNYTNGDSTDVIAGSGLASQDLINLALGSSLGTKWPANVVLALESDCSGDVSVIVYDKLATNMLADIADVTLGDAGITLDTTKEVCTGSGDNQTCDQPTISNEILVDVSFNSVGNSGTDSIDGGDLLTYAKIAIDPNSGCPTSISASGMGSISFTFSNSKVSDVSVTLLVTKASFSTGKKIGTL